jgi:hypothetical protein
MPVTTNELPTVVQEAVTASKPEFSQPVTDEAFAIVGLAGVSLTVTTSVVVCKLVQPVVF